MNLFFFCFSSLSSKYYFTENTYIEFGDLTRSRKGTFISDEKTQAEKIINDIVFMDAAYDLNQLPDLSAGINLFTFNCSLSDCLTLKLKNPRYYENVFH